jgi:hypothetical protein
MSNTGFPLVDQELDPLVGVRLNERWDYNKVISPDVHVCVYDSVQARQVDYDIAAYLGVQTEHEQYIWLSSAW